MKKINLLYFILSLGLCLQLSAQEAIKPLKLNVKYTITPLGDANVEVSSTMDAAQWDNYKKMIGGNPDILKRQMERTFPSYYLQNFNYKEDIMNRNYTLSFDALGMSKINSKGQWEIDLNMKNPDMTKLNDHNYILTSNFAGQNGLLQEIDNINFPSSATDVKLDKDAYGKAIFLYSFSPGGSSGGYVMLGLGVLLMAAGAFTFFTGSKKPVGK